MSIWLFKNNFCFFDLCIFCFRRTCNCFSKDFYVDSLNSLLGSSNIFLMGAYISCLFSFNYFSGFGLAAIFEFVMDIWLLYSDAQGPT